jgi:hypothetical protein
VYAVGFRACYEVRVDAFVLIFLFRRHGTRLFLIWYQICGANNSIDIYMTQMFLDMLPTNSGIDTAYG